MKNDAIIIVIMVVMVAFSAFQTMEISTLKNSVMTGNVVTDTVKTVEKTSGSGNYNLPKNLENLDTMVGGC